MVRRLEMEGRIVRSKDYIRNSYAQLLTYYYKTGVGKKSEIAGAIITDNLINTIETRYRQLGGDPVILRLKDYMPSNNGYYSKDDD